MCNCNLNFINVRVCEMREVVTADTPVQPVIILDTKQCDNKDTYLFRLATVSAIGKSSSYNVMNTIACTF